MPFKYSIESINTPNSSTIKQNGWIGFDLDGTLATYDKWRGWDYVGDPVIPMIDKVKQFLDRGIEVKVLTARASKVSLAMNNLQFDQMERVIQDWTEKHIGRRLPVVTEKDANMLFSFDDSIVQVEKNTGKIIGKEIDIE